jgi:hypothetical protein
VAAGDHPEAGQLEVDLPLAGGGTFTAFETHLSELSWDDRTLLLNMSHLYVA